MTYSEVQEFIFDMMYERAITGCFPLTYMYSCVIATDMLAGTYDTEDEKSFINRCSFDIGKKVKK